MSATNSTANYNLPLFIGSDKPAWLTDWNSAMNDIDSAIASVNSAQSGTATDLSALTVTVSGLSSTVSDHTTSINTLSTAVSGNTGAINTINSLIGDGKPTTTDKTIIGAINELYDDIHGAGPSTILASNVSYNNTASGLTADDVQEAIDELKSDIDNIQPPAPTGITITEKGSHTFASISAGAKELETITFSETYTNAPMILMSAVGIGGNNDSVSYIIACADNVTTTSFRLGARNTSSTGATDVTVNYIVIG